MAAADLRYEEIEVGMTRSFRRFIAEADVDTFAVLSGDQSPLHTDSQYAVSQTAYHKRLVHGMHLASLVSCLVGMHLPGFRSVCLAQQFDFLQPVYGDSEIEVMGTVASKNDAMRTIVLRTQISTSEGQALVKGKAIVKVLDTQWTPGS